MSLDIQTDYSLRGILAVNVGDDAEEPSVERLIKRYQLGSHASKVAFGDVLHFLRGQQTANTVAFEHRYITLFRVPSVDELFAHGGGQVTNKYEDILSCAKRGPLAPRLTWMIQVASAFAHLHDHDIVHGHIYPGNISITEEGHATVTNTGAYTETCRWVLDPHSPSVPLQESFLYQAPEFLDPPTGAYAPPTKAMDAYALGSTIYAVFAGVAPFRHWSTIVGIGSHGHMRIRQPAVIGDDLWHVIQRCWDCDPAARPTMTNITTALRDLQV